MACTSWSSRCVPVRHHRAPGWSCDGDVCADGWERARLRPSAVSSERCERTAGDLPPSLQVLVAQKVTAGVYKGVTTTELDELAAETAAGMTSLHPDYAVVRSQHVLTTASGMRGPARHAPYSAAKFATSGARSEAWGARGVAARRQTL